MPIQIDRETARAMGPRFDEALELVRNEFQGLDQDGQYRNAFARLLKADPLQRVHMLGTDQRDLFIPALRELIPQVVPPGGHILDLGAGDGQTFALLADLLAAGTKVSFEEPNAGYAADYTAFLAAQPHLRPGLAMTAGFEDIDALETPPPDGSVDLVLALHMLYFVSEVPAGLIRMARFLRPGGALCVVVTDQTEAYLGRDLRAFIDAGGDTGHNEGHLAAFAERKQLLEGALLDILAAGLPEASFELETRRQPSRLYGHALSDLIAMANLAELSSVAGIAKFEAPCDLLRSDPEAVDLRIEDEGPRKGMWSVSQPQLLSILRRRG